jgi:hypothetical protein
VINLSTAKHINSTLEPLMLSLADQQVVTGLAILIAAMINSSTISAYHYNIAIFSSLALKFNTGRRGSVSW